MRLPNDSNRLVEIGTTGSGKTQAGVYHLSMRSWDKMPWIVYDFKSDDLLNSIEGVRHIGVEELPKQSGLYMVHPHPSATDEVTNQMWRILDAENIGIYIDEGYMLNPDGRFNPAFRALLTQGRSKRIPIIILSQRPVWLDRFVFSEASFFQIFRLTDERDKATVASFVPCDLDAELPDYHSYWFDVHAKGSDPHKLTVWKPVPKQDELLRRFDVRMKKTSRLFFI